MREARTQQNHDSPGGKCKPEGQKAEGEHALGSGSADFQRQAAADWGRSAPVEHSSQQRAGHSAGSH